MSKVVKLLALSLLLTGCNGMNHKYSQPDAKKNHHVENDASRSVSGHLGHVTQNTAATASAVTNAARSIPRRP
jgi:PBP1b-binding outer membrane lipoprotein LpoB